MARYIDADMFKKKLADKDIFFPALYENELNETPTADVVEEVHGQWISTDSFDNFKTPIYQCSMCVREVADNYIHLHKYCLHCGAKMDGGNAE